MSHIYDRQMRARADVQSQYDKLTGGFFRPQTCIHAVHHPKCTIKKNGDCEVCGVNIDAIHSKNQPSYVTKVYSVEED